ncbi:MAG: hypothetical protein QXT45_06400 [Candidatus Bilamarchaeaceae archaeon]
MKASKRAVFVLLIVIGLIIIGIAIYNITQEKGTEKDASANATKENTSKDKESCEALGGVWKKIGISPIEVCNLPTSDANKECTSSDECEGICVAELSQEELDKIKRETIRTKGRCTAWRIVVGCRAVVENGEARLICLD